jgi:hypothetical protein
MYHVMHASKRFACEMMRHGVGNFETWKCDTIDSVSRSNSIEPWLAWALDFYQEPDIAGGGG